MNRRKPELKKFIEFQNYEKQKGNEIKQIHYIASDGLNPILRSMQTLDQKQSITR
ncbi:hypothetical protein YTPLAS21_13000 [Candidatus Nitrosocosmicus sp.]|jgi:hypothetical protein|nr:hypothetical protein YTPLAS21_13000 [Candidatus Nitrosocosmicus sp.]